MSAAPRRLALALWVLALLACAAVVSRTSFTADLSAFLPRLPSAEQQLLVNQLRDGLVSRLILVGIEGGDADGRARVSRAMAAQLRSDRRFASVQNGEPVNQAADREYVFAHRYLLSPEVSPERFSEHGLAQAVHDSLALLASSAGLFTKSLLPRDPTGEVAAMLAQLDAGQRVPMHAGAWASRDGKRALLLAQTAGAGSDTDAQAEAMAAVQQAFASAAAVGPYQLVMTGPGVFSVKARDTIRHDVERLSAIGLAIIVTLLLAVYRSVPLLVLGLVPVLSGALAGIAAVSLGFGGAVHGLTLGFGTTLIGEAVDYSIYLFVQSAQYTRNGQRDQRAWLGGFWPTVRLGVLTSVCGFASLLLSGFPGLAQLGLYSIAGLATAALVTRFVLPQLVPATLQLRDVAPLGRKLQWLAQRAPRLRWLVLLLVAGACVVLVQHRGTLWGRELQALSPVSASDQALDSSLRENLGAPDVRYLVVVSGPDQESVLQGAERVAHELEPLVAQNFIGGYESPARYLPSAATQRQRQASLPPPEVLAQRLDAAIAGQPVRAAVFAPFLAQAEAARTGPLLQRESLRGTSMALAVDALLVQREGRWSATLPLRAPVHAPNHASAADGVDSAAVRAAIQRAGVPDTLFVDLKGESDRLYASYLREALLLSLAGLLAIIALLALALRSPRRVLATVLPLAAAALVVLGGLAALGQPLTLLHLVGLLLLAAVGSNYALFFNGPAADGQAAVASPHTLVSLLLANLTTVAAFGLLSLSSLPLLQAFGLTVGPGAVLALWFSAMLAPAAPSAATGKAGSAT
ncbi:MMPL family transporter [Cupriavidus taiwanensis]|uniref:MMPL family transporter n=1 Tax=Cupriavidus taiwanensis TaxID=164546 RepID=UPI000E10058C|nr:MMPL family transporter [Cupriavidus taiwanensis]SOY66181.1 putative exporter, TRANSMEMBRANE PROTEIN [Cupriavidus taiwanensis]SOY66186.1 putative exporter, TRANSMEMBRANE PROTEIN [Cupriavidus taiwanensis]SOY94261.1 putative exporter, TRANSMEMBRANE PROTEIN [Cupriavidus taiwanensis]SOZ70407.1 putative exporter, TRANSMEMBRANE PROTEIN [Cupriavidus taiwanensis]SOZ86118.1 putative exporter, TRANSMEMBRANE PROTEIN [Cupriavidus taiwanensis]